MQRLRGRYDWLAVNASETRHIIYRVRDERIMVTVTALSHMEHMVESENANPETYLSKAAAMKAAEARLRGIED